MIQIVKLREHPELAASAAEWFNQKWNVPLEAYKESIAACLKQESAVPQWYLAMEGDSIAGGLGVIENDYQRPDAECLCRLCGRKLPLPGHCRENAEFRLYGYEGKRHCCPLPPHRPHFVL